MFAGGWADKEYTFLEMLLGLGADSSVLRQPPAISCSLILQQNETNKRNRTNTSHTSFLRHCVVLAELRY